jgi:triacylglycerol esterase/lipase EstA (alpha/beta hydrolase family)
MIEERYYQKNIILVSHSMGGFVARPTIVHQEFRKGVVETILTLSSLHW